MVQIGGPKFGQNVESFDSAKYYPRERLFSILNRSKQALLIGVFADSGFGKTSFVYSYIAMHKKRAIWYNLNSIDRFGADFIQDFKNRLIQLGLQFDIQDDGYEDIISAFYALSEPLLIVFDNYHFADNNSDMVAFIQRILSLEIDMIKIILVGKIRPNISFTKLKSKQQYIEIDSSDLAFTKEETHTFFNEYHQQNLKKFEIEIIHEKTAGWAAGYQLILEYLRKGKNVSSRSLGFNFFADIPDMFEYLSKEVFEAESAEAKAFMLKTSLMPELDPDIIDQFLGIDNSAETIDYLIQHHVFIGKSELGVVQYHRIFRQFLYELNAKADQEAIRKDHRRLSEIYRKSHRFIDSFAHALACADYILASELMSVIVSRYNPIQFINVIDGQLEEISPVLLFSDTTLFLTRCIPEKTLLEFIIPLQDAVAQSEKAQNILKLANLQHRLATIFYQCGEIVKSRDLLESSLEKATLLQDYSLMACNQQLLADCYHEMKEYDKGMQYARQALFLTEKYAIHLIQIHTLEVLTRLSIARQEYLQAESYISQALDFVDSGSYLLFWLYVAKSRLLLVRNDPDAVVWAQKAINCLSKHGCNYDRAYTYNNLGYIYLAADQLELSKQHLDIAYANSNFSSLQRYYIVENQINLYRLAGEEEKETEKRQELVDICNIHGYDWLLPEILTPNVAAGESDEMLTVRTLGAFVITCKGERIFLKRSSSLRLFQFLIVNRHRSINRDVIIEAIFSDYLNDQTNNFNVALSVLRKMLEPGIKSGKDSRFISRKGDRYQLNMDKIHLDVDVFLRLCSNESNIEKNIRISQLLQAEVMYQGDFMEEYPYEDYLEEERTVLRAQYMEISYALAEYFCERDEPLKSLAYFEKILVKDPYQEDIYLKYCEVLLSIKAISQAKDIAKRMILHIEEELGIPCKVRLAELFSQHQIMSFD